MKTLTDYTNYPIGKSQKNVNNYTQISLKGSDN